MQGKPENRDEEWFAASIHEHLGYVEEELRQCVDERHEVSPEARSAIATIMIANLGNILSAAALVDISMSASLTDLVIKANELILRTVPRQPGETQ